MGFPLRPLKDHVVVSRIKPEDFYRGIALPEKYSSDKEMVHTGKVLAIGEDVKADLRVDDIVLYGRWSGTEAKVSVDGEDCRILKEEEILCVREDS